MENPSQPTPAGPLTAEPSQPPHTSLDILTGGALAGIENPSISAGINMDRTHKNYRKQQRLPPRFQMNAEMAIRAACGVIVASFIQMRDPGYDPAAANVKKWRFFPDWYYLGGLSYCAVMVVFSMGRNVGGTLREVWRGVSGVGMAFIYNFAIFSYLKVQAFDSSAAEPFRDYYRIEKPFNSEAYWVNLPNLLNTLPWMVFFTVATLLLPFNVNTRKFALGSNAYYMLTIINPANPLNPSDLIAEGDAFFGTDNILRNLQVYSIVGIVGGLVSVLTMLIPYPIMYDISSLLGLVVDTYCSKSKSADQTTFLRLKLDRKFNAIEARHRQMQTLLDDVWWEQCVGLHFLLRFNHEMTASYVALVGSLIGDLHTLHGAIRLEQYQRLHSTYMKVLHREIAALQTRSGDLLREISTAIQASSPRLELKTMHPLENQVETMMYKYRKVQNRTLRTQKVAMEEVAGNMPLNLFLFSLNSFCATLINFQRSPDDARCDIVRQAGRFVLVSLKAFVSPSYYNRPSTWLTALKGSLSVMAGVFLGVHVYGFSSTVAGTISYIMGNYLGGSFRVTVNRVGGVVAGSVVPSVFKFFFVQLCDPSFLNETLSGTGLFAWVAISMYVCFAGEYSSYAGLVSAFISADTLLRQSDICLPNGTESPGAIVIASYSSLAQTSVGVVIFIVVETLIFPRSATSLLSKNIQDTVKLQQRAFDALFGYHLSSSVGLQEDTMREVRQILEVDIPRKLVRRKVLLGDAQAEPVLWRSPFSRQKHERVLDISHRMLSNINVLFKLVCWFDSRVEQKDVALSPFDIRDSQGGESAGEDTSTRTKWYVATNHFLASVRDRFDTIHKLYGNSFWHCNPEHSAIFMQMKEAFRLADRNCTGELDADDVYEMLEKIFDHSGGFKEEEIQQYVQEFMAVVGKGERQTISFQAFADAVENGLQLEVEVTHRRRPRASSAGSNAITPRLSSPRVKATSEVEPSLQIARRDDVAISVLDGTDNDRASSKPNDSLSMQGYIDGSITRRVLDRRGSVVVEEVSLTITPNLVRNLNARSDSDDDDESSALLSDYTSAPLHLEPNGLEVADFSIRDIAQRMKFAYVEWLVSDKHFENVSMEEQLLLQCLVSGAEGIARNLTELEEVAISI